MAARFLRMIPALVAALTLSGPAAAAKWESLFNGTDLSGWHQIGGGKWTVQNGTILGETGDGRYGWLVTDKEYGDFILELRFKTEAPGNSGVQFRSHVCDDKMNGWQAEVDPARGHNTGGIYEQGLGRGWLAPPPKNLDNVLREGQWNHYRITVIGAHITTHLNGVKMVELDDDRAVSGITALQVHSGDTPVRVRWKDIRIKDMGFGKGWIPLFNGHDLTGWVNHGKEKWTVENGEIVGEAITGEYGYLGTEKTYRNFVLRARFKAETQGNSGIFFHSTLQGTDIRGIQAEIDPTPSNMNAGLYESGGRGWLAQPNKDAQCLMRFNDWNDVWIICDRSRIVTYLNGFQAAVFDDKEPRFTDGVIALQLHSGGGVKMRFKDIYIKELP